MWVDAVIIVVVVRCRGRTARNRHIAPPSVVEILVISFSMPLAIVSMITYKTILAITVAVAIVVASVEILATVVSQLSQAAVALW